MAGMASKWIGVSKKLPRRGDEVIVASRQYSWSNALQKYRRLKTLKVESATYWGQEDDGPHFSSWPNEPIDEPVAWMPLPEPPEVK
jgi:hypothetical protein